MLALARACVAQADGDGARRRKVVHSGGRKTVTFFSGSLRDWAVARDSSMPHIGCTPIDSGWRPATGFGVEPSTDVGPNGPTHNTHMEGTMANNTLKLTAGVPDRFIGHEVTYETVAAVPGDVEATLENARKLVDPEADFAEVVADMFNGYGFTYKANSAIKAFLKSDEAAKMTVEEALAGAAKAANATRLGSKPTRTGGGGSSAKKALDSVVQATLNSYREASTSDRKRFRPLILAQGQVTEAQLDEIDAEK